MVDALSTIEGPAVATVFQHLNLAETVAFPQPLLKAALLAHCPSGHLALSAHTPPQCSIHGSTQQCACAKECHRSVLTQAYMPLLADVAPEGLNLSHSFFHGADTHDLS